MSIYVKILNVKKKIGTISKESTNPFFKSKYMDLNTLLDSVDPLLQEEGIILLQPILDGKVCTMLIDSEDEVKTVKSEIKLPELTDPQKLGSCITYYRRYTLKSLLGIQEDDDDGNKASKKKVQIDERHPAWLGGLKKFSSLEKMKEYFVFTKENENKYEDQLNTAIIGYQS